MLFFNKFLKKKTSEFDRNSLPAHIAIIMDGNGRWARKRGLPRHLGHREGSGNLKKIVNTCDSIGIKHLTVYAFSTENWKRPTSEVDALMSLLLEYLKKAQSELEGKNIRFRILGDIKALSPEIQEEISKIEKITEKNLGLNFNIALNYGSRDEIVNAVRGIVKDVSEGKLDIESINDSVLSGKLYTAGIPDPDLLIRTGGEQRISNFLLWQAAYSEFWYTDVYWPDFDSHHLMDALKEYQDRNRRYGGV